jgi:hypothetical protein
MKLFLLTRALRSRAGLILTTLVAVALVVGLVAIGLVRHGATQQRLEFERQQNEAYIDTRQRIDTSVRANPPSADHNVNRQWLLERQQQRDRR